MKCLALKGGWLPAVVLCLVAPWPATGPVASGQEKVDKGQAAKDELAALQGTWRLLRWEEDGKLYPVDKESPWVVKGAKLKNADLEGTLEVVDATTTPAKLNIQVPERKLDEFIYVRAGDYLIMCGRRGGPRPSEFKTAPNDGSLGINQFLVWKIER